MSRRERAPTGTRRSAFSQLFTRPFVAPRSGGGLVVLFLRDHHFSGRVDGHCSVDAAKLELANGIAGDDGGQGLIANAQSDLREQAVAADFLDESPQTIPAAQRDDESAGGRRSSGPRRGSVMS